MITTPRLTLIPITPQTIRDLFRSNSDEEIKEFLGVDEMGFNHYREMYLQGMETHRISHFFFLIILNETNKPIGECGFHTWNKIHKRAELFYLLRQNEYKKQGIMTEALRYVLQFGFTELQLHRIQACVAIENLASLRLVHKYGFIREGTSREDYCINGINEDSEVYSLLIWEWEKQHTKSKLKSID